MSDFFFQSQVRYGQYTTFTPTSSWGVTNTTYTGNWYRLGENMVINYKIALSGAPISTQLLVNLPLVAGVTATIDQTKLLQSGVATRTAILGTAMINDTNGSPYIGHVTQNDSTSFLIGSIDASATSASRGAVTQAVPMTFASGDDITIQAVVPITGWSA